jgi:hypothetical protein
MDEEIVERVVSDSICLPDDDKKTMAETCKVETAYLF